jgi:hypothetical protein
MKHFKADAVAETEAYAAGVDAAKAGTPRSAIPDNYLTHPILRSMWWAGHDDETAGADDLNYLFADLDQEWRLAA